MIIIRFMGGLGNQMFQYALYRKFKELNYEVRADLSFYNHYNTAQFDLLNTFPNISIKEISEDEVNEKYIIPHKERGFLVKVLQKLNPGLRLCMWEKKDGVYDRNIWRYKECYLVGYWQSQKYWVDIADIIRKEFTRDIKVNPAVGDIVQYMEENETVSVHVRRGDYLSPENQKLFGNICTIEYYTKAIEYFRNKNKAIKFIFFSNDTEWVRKNFDMTNCIIASDMVSGKIPDSFDMSLMSLCKHNIIANSSFSWWGAYLNAHKNKIVIAPKKWLNGRKTRDVWVDDWIRM